MKLRERIWLDLNITFLRSWSRSTEATCNWWNKAMKKLTSGHLECSFIESSMTSTPLMAETPDKFLIISSTKLKPIKSIKTSPNKSSNSSLNVSSRTTPKGHHGTKSSNSISSHNYLKIKSSSTNPPSSLF